MTYKILPLAFVGLLAAAWGGSSTEGVEVDATDATEGAAPVGQATVYTVDPAASSIAWTGGKLVGGDEHTGTLSITEGRLAVQGEAITAGDFVVDMNSLTVTDLDENSGKSKLEGHLKNEDFFEANTYPTSTFEITGVEAVTGEPGVTHRLTGNLTMKGVAKQVTIPANVTVSGDRITANTPAFEIDRQQWGIQYGSGALGIAQDKIIKDEMVLEIDLVATRG